MKWYYASQGKQIGPIDEAEFHSLVSSGKIRPDTLVWREGMANWASYSEAAAAFTERLTTTPAGARTSIPRAAIQPQNISETTSGAAPSGGGVICSQCGGTFPIDQVIKLEGRFVCGNCKPMVVQRIQEGVDLQGTTDPEALGDRIVANGYDISIGSCLSRAWQIFTANLAGNIGVTILVFAVLWLASSIMSGLANILIQPHLMAGLYLYYLLQIRGQNATVNDAFSGFRRYGQLAMAGLVVTLAITVCMTPFIVMALFNGGNNAHSLSTAAVAAMIIGGIISFVAIVYLGVSWLYVFPLILDKQIKWNEALRLSRRAVGVHFIWFLGFLFVCGILAIAGFVALLIGALVSLPFVMIAQACAYEQIFGAEETSHS